MKPNPFQRYFIPEESFYVRLTMKEAARCAESKNLLKAHGVSVLLATIAVAMSVFNTFSYLLQIPFKAILNVFDFKPHYVIPVLLKDMKNVALSFIFVALGLTLIVAAALVPKVVLYFDPYIPKTQVQLLEEELKEKEEEKRGLKNDAAMGKAVIAHLGAKGG